MALWMQAAGRRLSGSALGDALVVAYQTRTTALAAEASFWAVFALPWLIMGLVAGISRFQGLLGIDAVEQLRTRVLDLADQVLTPEAIDDLLEPLLDSVFGRGQTTLGVLGVIIAIWAGSRVVDALVNAMTIVYRREGLRSFIHSKLLSLGVYVAGLSVLILAIPLILAGPTFLARVVPGVQGTATAIFLVIAQVAVVLLLVVSLYHWAVPHRTAWTADIPGALIAMVLWVGFSWALRWYFAWIFRAGLGVRRHCGARRGHVLGLRHGPGPDARCRVQRCPGDPARLVRPPGRAARPRTMRPAHLETRRFPARTTTDPARRPPPGRASFEM